MPFTNEKKLEEPCPKCGNKTLVAALWESFDEAHEDVKTYCTTPGCKYAHWAEGIDS